MTGHGLSARVLGARRLVRRGRAHERVPLAAAEVAAHHVAHAPQPAVHRRREGLDHTGGVADDDQPVVRADRHCVRGRGTQKPAEGLVQRNVPELRTGVTDACQQVPVRAERERAEGPFLGSGRAGGEGRAQTTFPLTPRPNRTPLEANSFPPALKATAV
jgi:hypothetical protein